MLIPINTQLSLLSQQFPPIATVATFVGLGTVTTGKSLTVLDNFTKTNHGC